MPVEHKDSKKRNTVVITVLATIAIVVVVVAIVLSVSSGPSPDNPNKADGQSSESSKSGIVELSDGTKIATYVDEDSQDDAESGKFFGAGLLDEEEFEDYNYDPAGAGEDGLGLSYYKKHRPATDDEVAALSARLEGWWRPFIASSNNASVRIHDGVCQEFSGDGQLIKDICTIGQAGVIRFDEGMLNGYASFTDGPGFFIGGLFTGENPSDYPSTYTMEGAFLCDVTPEGTSERMEELQLAEVSVGVSGYLYRIEAPYWAQGDSAGTAENAGNEPGRSSDRSSADERAAKQAIEAGKQIFTGTVVITTKGERRKELGLKSRSDDAETIAYLKFDEPRECIQSVGDTNMAFPDCTSLGFTDPSKWKKYRGKRIMVSADVGSFEITDESIEKLYDFTGTFELVKVCEDDESSSGAYRAVGVIKA